MGVGQERRPSLLTGCFEELQLLPLQPVPSQRHPLSQPPQNRPPPHATHPLPTPPATHMHFLQEQIPS